MAYNGSGNFSPDSAYFPAVSGALIESAKYNGTVNDIATGLSNAITKDGQTTIASNLPMSGFRHTGVGNAVTRTDYAATGQVQDSAFLYAGTAGGTADAITLALTPAISAYATGQSFTYKSGASANTGAMTVNVSGVGAKAMQKNGAALVEGDHPASKLFRITYDGTAFQLEQVTLATVDTTSAQTISGVKTFSGASTALTAAADTNTTQIATTAFVIGQAGGNAPLVNGDAAAVGTSKKYSREDHVHPLRPAALTVPVATSSGSSVALTTSVPTWARRVTLMFSGVSTNGTAGMQVQIGPSGGLETTGYVSSGSSISSAVATSSSTTGFIIRSSSASAGCSGVFVLQLYDFNNFVWTAFHNLRESSTGTLVGAGDKTLAGALTRVSLVTTDTFDAGAVSVTWE